MLPFKNYGNCLHEVLLKYLRGKLNFKVFGQSELNLNPFALVGYGPAHGTGYSFKGLNFCALKLP